MKQSLVGVKRKISTTAPRYIAVSIFTFVLGSGILFFLTEYIGFHIAISGAITGMLGIVNDFIWHERWTFIDVRHGNVVSRFARFFLSKTLGYFVALGTLVVLTEAVGIHYLMANVFAVGASFIWNYTLSITWIWRVR